MYWLFAIKSQELHSRAEGAEGLQGPAGIQGAKSCSLLLRISNAAFLLSITRAEPCQHCTFGFIKRKLEGILL